MDNYSENPSHVKNHNMKKMFVQKLLQLDFKIIEKFHAEKSLV